jgi:hypothetical protein
MPDKILLIGICVFLFLSPVVCAADIEGSWIAKSWDVWPRGEITFRFRVDGAKLTGTLADHQGEAAIQEGKINGDEISFFVIRSSAGGEAKLVYSGKIAENEINFSWTVQGTDMRPQKLNAKREFLRNNDYIPRRTTVPVRP